MNEHGPAGSTPSTERTRAEAKVIVEHSEAEQFDPMPSPALLEIRLHERFTGDLDGESIVRALQVKHADESANLVSLQRFEGTLKGRRGTFVLQGSERIDHGKIEATWFVVPGTGTGDLAGIRGEGGFAGEFGKGSDATLDYWFERA